MILNKNLFIKYFAPTKLEGKREILFKNGSSIKTKFKSDYRYLVQYLPGNYADYLAPKFIITIKKKVNIIPYPNFKSFLFIPVALIIFYYDKKLDWKEIQFITICLILFYIILQLLLLIPSIYIIKKRVNKHQEN